MCQILSLNVYENFDRIVRGKYISYLFYAIYCDTISQNDPCENDFIGLLNL